LVALVITTGLALGGGVLAAGLMMPAVTVAGTGTQAASDVLDAIDADLEIPQLSQKSYMYDLQGNLLTEFYLENRVVVPLDRISQPMQDAVIALEDHRFWEHSGVDLTGMIRAFVNNSADGSTQGASTITQQYVKNALITRAVQEDDAGALEDAQEATYTRKLKEAKLAVALEKKVGKAKVLEGYLNIAQFGQSVYGVEAAAYYYFGVSAQDLDVVQAATIAAVTQSPATLDPAHNPQKNQVRRDDALAAMLREGYISQAEYDQSIAVDVTESLNLTPTKTGCEEADSKDGAGFFCEYVTQWLLHSEAFGPTRADRQTKLEIGGLHIYTTLDPATQAAAKEAVDWRIPPDSETAMGTALSAVEPGTGKIRAMAQNRFFSNNPKDATATSVNYNVDKQMGGATGFQAGSAFKPIVLAEWLTQGHSLNESFDGTRTNYQGTNWQAHCEPEGTLRIVDNWQVKGSSSYYNAVEATTRSSNTAYAAMEYKLDLCRIEEMAAKLGVNRADGQKWNHYPSQVFGSNEVTPLAMAGAYATFAAEGKFCEPTPIEKVVDAADNEVVSPSTACTQALDQDVARGVNLALQRVVSYGTGTNANLWDRPVAGKTGTTDDSMAVWFVGYTPQLAAATWAGNPRAASEGLVGEYRWASGGSLMAASFKRFMAAAMDGQPVESFERPSNELERGKPVQVPGVQGMSEADARWVLQKAGLVGVVGDSQASADKPVGTVLGQSPSAGSWQYPGTQVTLTISSGPPPEPPPEPPAKADQGNSGNNRHGHGKPADRGHKPKPTPSSSPQGNNND